MEKKVAALVLPTAELALETRRKTSIKNFLDRSVATVGAIQQSKDLREKYQSVTHRPIGPCATFNCHGLTFGARRTWIDGIDEIETILREDDYKEISLKEVLAGDIAIYRKDKKIEHSGIVVEAPQTNLGLPKILSKWGNLHEAIHLPFDGPYADMEVKYYRIEK